MESKNMKGVNSTKSCEENCEIGKLKITEITRQNVKAGIYLCASVYVCVCGV